MPSQPGQTNDNEVTNGITNFPTSNHSEKAEFQRYNLMALDPIK